MATVSYISSRSSVMRAVEDALSGVASTEFPVLIVGETGTGKRALGERLHALSNHAAEPFRVVNCARFNGTQVSFSSQSGTARSFWDDAEVVGEGDEPGTVYLHEIGDLTWDAQYMVLDALFNQHGTINLPRVIASTRRDLYSEIKSGRFREDLYYRLSAVCLPVPPLRQRREDVSVFLEHFLEIYAKRFGMQIPSLSPDKMAFVESYEWPGNLRELENTAKALLVAGERVAFSALRDRPGMEPLVENVNVSLKRVARAASLQAQRELIVQALSNSRWNRKRAAEQLQISYKALLYKMREVGLVAATGQTEQ